MLVSESGNRDPVHRFPDSTLHVNSRGKNLRSLNRGIGDPKFHFESGCRVPGFPGSSLPRFPDSPVRFGSLGCCIVWIAAGHSCNVHGSPVRCQYTVAMSPVPRFDLASPVARFPDSPVRCQGIVAMSPVPHCKPGCPDSHEIPIQTSPRFAVYPDSPVHHSPIRPRFLSSNQ